MATHYISPSGSASWANSTNSGTPCSMATANSNAAAGDVVVMAGGTYTTGIQPANSGNTQWTNTITYTCASGATVIIRAYRCIDLILGQGSITVQKGDGAALILNDPGYRYIDCLGNQYITIDGVRTTGADSAVQWSACHFQTVRYLVIKNCSFASDDSTTNRGYDFVHLKDVKYFDIGPDNIFGNSPHGILYIAKSCRYGRVHSNTHNNFWRHGMNIEDAYTITGADNLSPRDILIEDNFFDRTGSLSSSNPWLDDRGRVAHSIENGGSQTIIRNNIFYKTHSNIEYFCQAGKTVQNNYYYHNTGYKPTKYVTDSLSGLNSYTNMYGTLSNNRILNNIFSEAQGDYTWRWLDQGGSQSGNQITNNIIYSDTAVRTFRFQWFANVYTSLSALQSAQPTVFSGNRDSNPLLNSPEDLDFDLGATSSAVASASFLATVVSKNSNTLTLGTNEAYAFAPADWLVPNFSGDTIYNQDGDSATVTARPAHNQITLDDASDFAANDTLTVIAFSGAAPDIGASQTTIAPPVVVDGPAYVGWTTSSGEPETDPTSDVKMADDRTYLVKWTATGPGTVYSVRFFVEATWSATIAWVVVYKMEVTTLRLIGYALLDEVIATDSWTQEKFLQTPLGVSAGFVTGDDLYYGVSADPASAQSVAVGREETGGSGLYWSQRALNGQLHYILEAADMETMSAGRDMAFVLGYLPPAADTTAPTITMISPAASPYTATGVHTLTVSGSASDESGMSLVTWESDLGGAGVANGAYYWSFLAPISAGATVFTITAFDAFDNDDDIELTVNFAAPTGSATVGWTDTDGGASNNPPEDDPTSITFSADRTYLFQQVEMAADGRCVGVYFYVPATWNPLRQWVVVYKLVGANLVLIASAEVTSVAYGAWNYIPVTAVSGQSTAYYDGDYITAGIACDVTTSNLGGWGRNTTGGTGLRYSTQAISGAPISSFVSADMLFLASYEPGFALCYVPDAADTSNPVVVITSHTTPYQAGTAPTITIAGTVSDNVRVASVTWADDQGHSGTAVGSPVWMIESATLIIGTTIFTITATDGAGNTGTAELTVRRVSNVAAQLPKIYDGDKVSGAVSYTSTVSGGEVKWVQYAYKIQDIIDRVIFWSQDNFAAVVALSEDGTTWTYYGAVDSSGALDSQGRLVSYGTSWPDYPVVCVGGGAYNLPLPNAVTGRYGRLYFHVPQYETRTINEMRFVREVVAEQIYAENIGAISIDATGISAGIVQSQNLTGTTGILLELTNGYMLFGGTTNRSITIDGRSSLVHVREGGKIEVGLSNVVLDSTNVGGSQGRIIVAPDGGTTGQDYVRMDHGNVYQMVYSGGQHHEYSMLTRQEDGVGTSGQVVQIPGYWLAPPHVSLTPEETPIYNAAFPEQNQKMICRAENVQLVPGASHQYQFTGRMTLEVTSASLAGAGTMTGVVRTPATRLDFPALTVTCSTVESGCQRLVITYSHNCCFGVTNLQQYSISRTVVCEIYYSGAWYMIASEYHNKYTTYADRIFTTADSGWRPAQISSYRLRMFGTNAYDVAGGGDSKSQSLEPVARTEYLSQSTQTVNGIFHYRASGR